MKEKCIELWTKYRTRIVQLGVVIYSMFWSAVPAMADVDIAHEVTSGLAQVYKIITAVVLPVAIIALAVCAFKMVSNDTKAGDAAKATAIKICVGIAIVYMAPFLVMTVSGWFSRESTTINGVSFGG